MYKSNTKATAIITIIALLVSLLSVFVLPVYAQAPIPEDFEPQRTLDYDALFDDALVVNTGWSSLSGKLSFVYQGKSYSETYNKSRHFKDFNTAVNNWSGEGTPVIIVNGTLLGDLNISGDVIVLGANAGKSPNTVIDLATVNPTKGWPAATLNNQTYISGTFVYDVVETEAKEYSVVFDGVTFNGSAAGFKTTDSEVDANKTVNVTVQHVLVKQAASSAFLFDHRMSDSVFTYAAFDLRVEKASLQGLFATDAVKIHIDSLCFNDNAAAIITGTMSTPEFDFDLRNSYIYNNHVGYTIWARYTEGAHHVSNIDIHNNIFYNSNTGNYGFMVFHSTENSPKSAYNVNVRNNTIMSTGDSRTLFNGSSADYQKGTFTVNCNYNRVIGYVSLFPNMSLNSALGWESANMIKADFNYNYFNTTYTSHADVIDEDTWERSDYYTSHPYIDPYDSELIVYYKDYMLTVRDGMFDITGVDFFDDVDSVGIDNENNEITLTIPKGTTVSGLSKDYGFNFATEPDSVLYYYKDKVGGTDVKVPVTSLSAAPPDTFDMYFVDVTYKTYTETYFIMVYGDITYSTKDFEGNFSDPAGEIASSAYLYVPGLSGTTYTLSWNGSRYSFKVGDNAFDSLAKIYTKAKADGISVPQILVPAGSHGALDITNSCEIYGYNYLTAATGGVLADTRYPGSSWNTPKRTEFSAVNITDGASVKLSGVTVNGNITDTARTTAAAITVKNSIINGYIDMSNTSVKTKAGNSLTLSGVLVENGAGTLIKNEMPCTVTLSNVYTKSGVTKLFDKGWASGIKDVECRIDVTGSRFDGVGDAFVPSPVTEAFTDAAVTINKSSFYTESAISALITADKSKYTTELTGNAFVNKGTKSCLLIWGAPALFKENRIIGFTPGFTADYNYLADYTSNFKTALNGKQYGELFYVDFALTTLNNEYGIESVTLGDSGAARAVFSNTSKTVRITLGSGDASSVKIFMKGGVEAKIYTDAACTNPADLKTAVFGKTSYFYTKTDFAAATGIYRIIVDSKGSGNDFSFDFESDDIKSSAIAVSSDFGSYADGDSVVMNWQGKDWKFIKGINAFASMDEMILFASEKALDSPQILIGKHTGDLVIDYGCEVYSQNYKTVPYLRTDSFDGSDWSYNTEYDKNKTTVGNIIIGENAKGAVKVYGFEMTGTYKDISRPAGSMLNVHLENILINNTVAATVLFNQNGDNVRVNASKPRNENIDTFTVKNTYIQSSVATRFMYEWHSQTVEFDGLYMDCAYYPIAATNYIKQAGVDTKLIFRNCNLRNLYPTANLFQFEGNRVTVSKGQYRQFIFENNIIYNFKFSSNGFLPFYPSNFTGVTMQNNRLINTLKNQNLFHNMYNSVAYTPLTLTIKDNVFAGFNTTIALGTNKVNTASVISGNFTVPAYTARAKGQPLSVTANPNIECINYALDDTLEPLNTDFTLKSVTGSGSFALEGTTVTASLVGITLLDVKFTFGNSKIQPQFFTDENCTKAADALTATEGTYYVRGLYTAADGVKFYGETVYTVNLTSTSVESPLFSKNFEDDIIPKTAILIDKDCASAALLYETTWCKTKYAFVKDTNVFETLAAAVEYVKAAGIEDPHFMLKDIDGKKGDDGILDFFVPHPGSYYTQNYNIKPYVRGTAQDGSDWKSNIGTGAGQFNTANGITCYWIGFNKCPSGNYNLYGFTVRSCIQDGTRAGTTINVVMHNTYFRDTHSSYSAFVNNNSSVTAADNETNDTITFKDMYYVDQSANSFFRAGIDYVWTNTIFDGLFADFSGSPHVANNSIVRNRAQYGQTVYRNCNLRNFRSETPYITFASIDENTSLRGSRKLILEDNIFYNYCFYDKAHFLGVKLGYHTDVELKNNRIYLDDKAELIYTPENAGNGITDDLNLVITGNHMRGIDGTVYVDNRNLAPTSVVEKNYLSKSPTYLRQGVALTAENNLAQTMLYGPYYLDKEMTTLSNAIDKMTFDDVDFNSDLDYNVASDVDSLDVAALLDDGFNTVEFFMDPDLELAVNPKNVALSNLGRTVYLLVTSYDGTNSAVYELRIHREQGCIINNTGLGSTLDRVENDITFNWVGWLGTVNATGMTVNAADKITHRVGAVYLSDTTDLDAVKADIAAAVALQTEPDSIETIVSDVNDKYAQSKTIKAYCFHKDHTLIWNNEAQSYGFRYNFSIQDDYYRGVVMYVVYQDESGELSVKFSDMVVQQS